MERENKKRGREGGEGKKDLFVKTSKKQYQGQEVVEAQDENNITSDNNYMVFGVFDFPWLHDDDGIISKSDSDEWKFEDTFSTSLDDIEFTRQWQWQRQYLYETTTTTMNMNMNLNLNFPDNKFEGPFKGEEVDELENANVDCSIWSSMINQPLQQGVSND